MFAVTILGSNSAIPAFGRNPSAQVLQTQDDCFLIDCGEGTQMQIAKYKIKLSKLSHIFISHLHGDHYFGLIGLLSSMSLLNRTQDLHVFGSSILKDIIDIQLKAADVELTYVLHFHAIEKEGLLTETTKTAVHCFKVQHGIDCFGFLFKEKKNPRSIIPDQVKLFEIPSSFYSRLQMGEDYVNKKGEHIENELVTTPNHKARSYAYCADTRYDPSIIPHIQEVDLLYHETTYLKDQEEKAQLRFHSTSIQAASIAKQANVKKLIIGHFSSRYASIDTFLEEASSVFEHTSLAIEGSCYQI